MLSIYIYSCLPLAAIQPCIISIYVLAHLKYRLNGTCTLESNITY